MNTAIQKLETRLNRLEAVLDAVGLPVQQWLSPEQAGIILGVSRKTIMTEINNAERAHATNQKSDVKYSVHYRKIGSNWQVDPLSMKEIINKRPELRPVIH